MEHDIIGDVHGHADALEAMLKKLGYQNRGGAYRHTDPQRKVLFLGDLIDRGPRQLDTVNIARRMQNAGSADVILGNHELNAIGYATLDASGACHLRKRSQKNRNQHAAFLNAVGEDSELHKELVDWMISLPAFFDGPGFKAVHACWHPASIDLLKASASSEGVLEQSALLASFDEGDPLYKAIEVALKGFEIELPDGVTFSDKEGTVRTKSRIRWWDREARTIATATITEEGMSGLPETPLPKGLGLDEDVAEPVFFGHYWMSGTPYLLSENKACLDFSVAKNGYLTAYSWRGEPSLTPENMTWLR